MRILVTGGAGFIGSHVADAYLEAGHEVAILDNLSSGHMRNLPAKARFIQEDVISRETANILKLWEPDVVNHHAAQSSVVRSMQDPYTDAVHNVASTVYLLEQCVKYEVKRFIYANTAGALYGEPNYLPVMEDHHPIRPISYYGLSKYTGEQYVTLYSGFTGLETIALRYGNVYGPRQDSMGESGVVAIFLKNILHGEPVVVYGDGEQLRDYIHVDDVKQANLAALVRGKEAYHISTGVGTSVNEIVRLLEVFTGYDRSTLVREQARAGEVYRIYLDASKAKAQLNWEAQIDIRSGIKMTVDAFPTHPIIFAGERARMLSGTT